MKKNSFFIIFFIFIFFELSGQTTFYSKKITTSIRSQVTIQECDSKFTINSDTSEITSDIAGISFSEKISSLESIFDLEDYKIIVYKLENSELLILHLNKGVIFSIAFKTENTLIDFE
jgi:hypothetical protein